MFECIEILESIYEGVVEPFRRKPNRAYANGAGIRMKIREESAPSTTYYEIIERACKCRKGYVDHPKDILKLTCLIHVPGHSSDECKILGYFVITSDKGRPTKYRRK